MSHKSIGTSLILLDRDHLTEKVKSLDGDGQALIQALRDGEVAGSRTNRIEKLEEWLSDEGFIDPAEPFTREEPERDDSGDPDNRIRGGDDGARSLARDRPAKEPADRSTPTD